MFPRAALAGLLLLAACSTDQAMQPRELAAEDMPLRFAYGGLRAEEARRRVVSDPHRGTEARQLLMARDGEMASFELITTIGDYVLLHKDTRFWIRSGVPEDEAIVWQETGRLGGTRATELQTFAVPGWQVNCVGMQRALREHIEAGFGDGVQALAIGYYCRQGEAPIGMEEARTIAAALQARG